MNHKTLNRFVRLACTVVVEVFLIFASGPVVQAQSFPYTTKFYSTTDTSLCVGQGTTLMLAYHAAAGQTVPPVTFAFSATNGEILSGSPTAGGAGSGFVFVTVQADKAGSVTVTAEGWAAQNSTIQKIASAQISLPAEDCQYKYRLWLRVDVNSNHEGTILNWEDLIRSKGTFNPVPSNQVMLAPLVPNGKIDSTIFIKDQEMPNSGCTPKKAKWSGLKALGTALVNGQYVNNSKTSPVTFTFDSPKMSQKASAVIPCKDKPLTISLPLIDFAAISGIQETFPRDGGARVITIPALDKGVEALNISKWTQAMYTAILTIEKNQ
jgi:hypothetical protein